MSLDKQAFERNELSRVFDDGEIDYVELRGTIFARSRLEPGWTWRAALAATLGADTCLDWHLGIVTAGVLGIKLSDGSETTVETGDCFVIDPDHDGWVVGDESVEIFYVYPADWQLATR